MCGTPTALRHAKEREKEIKMEKNVGVEKYVP